MAKGIDGLNRECICTETQATHFCTADDGPFSLFQTGQQFARKIVLYLILFSLVSLKQVAPSYCAHENGCSSV